MFRSFLCLFVFLLISVEFASAQSSAAAAARRRQQQMQQKAKEMAENQPQLPSDPQLLTLHKEFIAKAERLAVEYERKKQLDKARGSPGCDHNRKSRSYSNVSIDK